MYKDLLPTPKKTHGVSVERPTLYCIFIMRKSENKANGLNVTNKQQ
jgi:hypothetical protein